MKRVYAGYVMAETDRGFEIAPDAQLACSKQEAIGRGMEKVLKHLRRDKGYYNHHCDYVEINAHVVEEPEKEDGA